MVAFRSASLKRRSRRPWAGLAQLSQSGSLLPVAFLSVRENGVSRRPWIASATCLQFAQAAGVCRMPDLHPPSLPPGCDLCPSSGSTQPAARNTLLSPLVSGRSPGDHQGRRLHEGAFGETTCHAASPQALEPGDMDHDQVRLRRGVTGSGGEQVRMRGGSSGSPRGATRPRAVRGTGSSRWRRRSGAPPGINDLKMTLLINSQGCTSQRRSCMMETTRKRSSTPSTGPASYAPPWVEHQPGRPLPSDLRDRVSVVRGQPSVTCDPAGTGLPADLSAERLQLKFTLPEKYTRRRGLLNEHGGGVFIMSAPHNGGQRRSQSLPPRLALTMDWMYG